MNRYMFILFDYKDVYAEYTEQEMMNEVALHRKWIEEMGEHFIQGDPLEVSAKTVRGAKKLITDGPFVEAKELIGGYYIIRADNIDEATQIAQGCPILRLGGSVEVRAIMEINTD